MASEEVAKWWQDSPKSDNISDGFINLPSPEEMLEFCHQKCPVLFFHLYNYKDSNNFWEETQGVMQKIITEETNLNLNDISNLNSFLFKYRNLFLLETIEDCLTYIGRMYKHNTYSFFINDFLLAVNDTDLAITVIHKINHEKNEMWMEFLYQRGMCERFLDFFIPYLGVPPLNQDENKETNVWNGLLELGDLLTDIIIHNMNIQDRGSLIRLVFRKLLKVIVQAPEEQGLNFLRFYINLTNVYFSTRSKYKFDAHMKLAYKDLIKCQSIRVKEMFINYAKMNKERISSSKVIFFIIYQKNLNNFHFNALLDFIKNGSTRTKLTVLNHLGKIVCSKSPMARSAMTTLVEVCGIIYDINNQYLVYWIDDFVRATFAHISACYTKKKYIRRSINILNSMSSTLDNFSKSNVVFKKIKKYASLANCPLISQFFITKPKQNHGFNNLVKKFINYPDDVFKACPFKKDAYQLVISRVYPVIVSLMPNVIENINIPSYYRPYFKINKSLDYGEHMESLFSLQDYLIELDELIKNFAPAKEDILSSKVHLLRGYNKLIIKNIIQFIDGINELIVELRANIIRKDIEDVKAIITELEKNPHLKLNVGNLISYIEAKHLRHKEFDKYNIKKNQLLTYVRYKVIEKARPHLKQAVTEAYSSYDENTGILLNSCLDNYIEDFMIGISSDFFERTGELIVQGDYLTAYDAIHESSNSLLTILGVNKKKLSTIIEIILLRVSFEQAYVTSPFEYINTSFMRKCEKYTHKNAKHFKFNSTIRKCFDWLEGYNGFTILSLYSNPYDLVVHLSVAMNDLLKLLEMNYKRKQKHFSSFFTAILALNPPADGDRICILINRCHTYSLMRRFSNVISLYSKAIKKIESY